MLLTALHSNEGLRSIVFSSPPLSSSHSLQQSEPRTFASLYSACLSSRGRGPQYYINMSSTLLKARGGVPPPHCRTEERISSDSSAPPAPKNVTHCCTMRYMFQGRLGNQLFQFSMGRFYAELHSCALTYASFSVGGEAHLDISPSFMWPPVGGEDWYRSHFGRDVNNVWWLRHTFASGNAIWMDSHSFYEYADQQYTALSLGWDLGGGSMVGQHFGGIGEEVMSRGAVEERCARWQKHREVCALSGLVGREEEKSKLLEGGSKPLPKSPSTLAYTSALHPWLPSQLRAEAEALLDGTAPNVAPPLAHFLSHLASTVVVHLRLGDVWDGNWEEMMTRGVFGQPEWGAHVGPKWRWVPVADPGGYRHKPSLADIPIEEVLQRMETQAAVDGWAVPPLSFYTSVLDAIMGKVVDSLLIVCEWDESKKGPHPYISSLKARYAGGGKPFTVGVTSGTEVRDFTTLLLAQHLILSPSTFSWSAAAQGAARVVHAPIMGTFMLTQYEFGQCLPPFAELDSRWVYHDVYRAAVDKVAEDYMGQSEAFKVRHGIVGTSGSESLEVLGGYENSSASGYEWRRFPLRLLPKKGPRCPPSSGAVHGESLARVLGEGKVGIEGGTVQSAPLTYVISEGGKEPQQEVHPYYFLSYRQLLAYHENLDCQQFYSTALASNSNGNLGYFQDCADNGFFFPRHSVHERPEPSPPAKIGSDGKPI